MEIRDLNSFTHDLLNILILNRSNNAKINASLLNILRWSLVKWCLTERIILCKINKISGWGIETFYLATKNTNFGLSTIHLVGVDMVEIAD